MRPSRSPIQSGTSTTKSRREPNETEAAALRDLRGKLTAARGDEDAEALQSLVYEVGREHGFEKMGDWFKALYEVLLGSSQGPRFGVFIEAYGVEPTITMIDESLGALAA